ncbi:MAG: DNA internalization-related competence protein ComEC/Rec2 [Syntrophobacteraceae bacterium]
MPSRPLVWITVFFMLGISADHLFGKIVPLPISWLAFFSLALIAAMAAALWSNCAPSDSSINRVSRLPVLFTSALLLFFLFGIWASKGCAPRFPKELEPFLAGRPACFTAKVRGAPDYYPGRIRVSLQLLEAITDRNVTPLHGGILLTLPASRVCAPGAFLLPGEKILFRACLKRFHNFNNPGGFDYVSYQAGKDLFGRCFLPKKQLLVKIDQEAGLSFGSILNTIRDRIELFRQKNLLFSQSVLAQGPAAFYAAMILGYKHLLDRKWEYRIHQTGLYHLLSVSGLHIGMVCIFIFWLFRLGVRLLFPSVLNYVSDQRLALLPATAAGIFYALLAGFGTPTIWRSVLTLAVIFAAALRYRAVDSLTVLALAALFILLPDPACLTQIPFQFTFLCVFAIIVLYPKFHGIRLSAKFRALGPDRLAGKIVRQFEDAFLVSLAINILLLPLIIYYFNGFSLAGIVANIFLLPYVGFVVLPVGLLGVVLFAVSHTLAWPVMWVLNYLLWVCLSVIKLFSGFFWSFFWTGGFSTAWLIVIYASLGLLLSPFPKKLKTAAVVAVVVAASLALAINSSAARLRRPADTGELKVDVIDVGQGSSALIRFPGGETMLVDGGGVPGGSYDIGSQVLAPFLWHETIQKLDYVVLSHYHPDHALGLCFILKHFRVGEFWTGQICGSDPEATMIMHRLDEIAFKQKIATRAFPSLFKSVTIGSVAVRLLHPTRDFIDQASQKNLNELSLVWEISFGKTRVILPGDIDARVEKTIIAHLGANMQTLLVAAHHGSSHSNCREFLDALRPVALIFSCGYDNIFHFPASVVLRRCRKLNIPVYRTDLQGDVHAVSNGQRWTIAAQVKRKGHGSLFHGSL